MATLYQPQLRSLSGAPHPVFVALLDAAHRSDLATAENSGPQRRKPRATRTKKATGEERPPAAPSPASQPQPVQAKPTLEEFISRHDKLLGAMAVLAALAAFMKDLQIIEATCRSSSRC